MLAWTARYDHVQAIASPARDRVAAKGARRSGDGQGRPPSRARLAADSEARSYACSPQPPPRMPVAMTSSAGRGAGGAHAGNVGNNKSAQGSTADHGAFLPFPIKCECVLPVDSGHSSFRAGSAYISQNSTVFKIRYHYVFLSKEISREPFGMPHLRAGRDAEFARRKAAWRLAFGFSQLFISSPLIAAFRSLARSPGRRRCIA